MRRNADAMKKPNTPSVEPLLSNPIAPRRISISARKRRFVRDGSAESLSRSGGPILFSQHGLTAGQFTLPPPKGPHRDGSLATERRLRQAAT